MASLNIRLLGTPEVHLPAGTFVELRSDKALALLAYLTIESDRAQRREKLSGMLWPGYTEMSARTSLRRALADLRLAIGDQHATPPYLLTTRNTIRFNCSSDNWVDVLAFKALFDSFKTSQNYNLEQLSHAVDYYRGPFMDGFSLPDSPEFEEWIVLTREQFFRQAIQTLSYITGEYKTQGNHELALRYAWCQLELDPWRENAHRQVMRLLALTGQRDAALAQYETCRDHLKAELGVEPSEETKALHQKLLKEEWPPSSLRKTITLDRISKGMEKCPYRGLSAFREQDAPFFFGRETIVTLILDALDRRPPFTALIGASGSGKSSIVYAGLLPRIRDDIDGKWIVTHCRPGGQPFQALAESLLEIKDAQISETDQIIETQNLASALSTSDLGLLATIKRILKVIPKKKGLLLIIDQFEELYTFCPDPKVQQHFLDVLIAAVKSESEKFSPSFYLLITLRADFMGRALSNRSFADTIQGSALMLGSMNRNELQRAIKEPALMQGVFFETGLIDRILDDVGEEPGNLPLLEFVLTLLWEQTEYSWLTYEKYMALGGVKGALAQYAEQVYANLDPSDQEKLPRILAQLVQPGEGTEDTRRVAKRAEIGEEYWSLTQHLADMRLMVTGRDEIGDEIVEVSHEALIQNWDRLQGWIESERVFRVWQEKLRFIIRQWEESGQDEGALLHGSPLVQSEEWLAAREDNLSLSEKEYIQASIALREKKSAEREIQRQRELFAERRSRRLWIAMAGVMAVAVIIALTLTIFSFTQQRKALKAYSLSLTANAREKLNDLDNITALSLAMVANQINDPPTEVQRLLLEAAYAPGARWRIDVEKLFPEVKGSATTLAFSPNGRSILTGMTDGSLILWDLETMTEIFRLKGHTARINDVAISSDGSIALSGGDDKLVILWDLGTGNVIHRFHGHSGTIRTVDISNDGCKAVSGGISGTAWMEPGELIIWDLSSGYEIQRLEGHIAGVVAAQFTPTGDAILASSGDAKIFSDELPEEIPEVGIVPFDLILWEVDTGQINHRFEGLEDDVYCLSISADGTKGLTGSFYNNVSVVWDLETGRRISTLKAHHEGVVAVDFSKDGRRAISASYDDSLILWDMETWQPIARLNAHNSDVLDLDISSDGRTAISSSIDGGLILWDLVDTSEIQRLAGHRDMVWDVAFTPDGKRALSSSGASAPSIPVQDASIRLWDLETAKQLQVSNIPVDVIFQVAISPDGHTALVATNEPFLRIWDLDSWQETGRLEGHAMAVTGVEFLPDGQKALSISVDGRMILWDLANKIILHSFSGHGEALWSLAISPDGHKGLSDSNDSSMVLWDMVTGVEVRSFLRQDQWNEPGSSGMAFLPDGRSALACEADGSIIEWDLETGQEIRKLGTHPSLRTRVVITPDGLMAVTSGMDGNLILLDLNSGELIRKSIGHGVIFDLALAPDGQTVLFGSSDTTIVQWRIDDPSLDELKAWVAANRYLPELTCEERETYQIEPLCKNSEP